MRTARVGFTLVALVFAGQLSAAGAQSQFTRSLEQGDQMRFRGMDRNGDGVITRVEWRGSEQAFRDNDWNSDGILSGDEVAPQQDTQARRRAVPRSGSGRGPVAAGTAGQGECTSNAAQIVDDIYQQVLERSADNASAGMTQGLASGQFTVRDIVGRVAKSPEHAERFFWRPIVRSLYSQVLNREPSDQELQDTAASLATGERRLPEVIAHTAARATNNNEDAVRILYRRLLGREADPQGLASFTQMAERQGIEAVARQIIASPEYKQHASRVGMSTDDGAAYDGAVRSLYRHLLGRDADQIGIQDLKQVATMYGFEAVVDRMITSPEYTQLYGTDVVPVRGSRFCGVTR